MIPQVRGGARERAFIRCSQVRLIPLSGEHTLRTTGIDQCKAHAYLRRASRAGMYGKIPLAYAGIICKVLMETEPKKEVGEAVVSVLRRCGCSGCHPLLFF